MNSRQLPQWRPGIYDSGLGIKNLIINGNFNIWQRGTSFSMTTNKYVADRWYSHSSGTTTITRESQTVYLGNILTNYFLRVSRTSAGSASKTIIAQAIEDVKILPKGKVTLSYYAKVSSGTKVISAEIALWYGSGGSGRVTISEVNHTITTTWTKFVHTFTMPDISSKTIGADNAVIVEFLEESNFSTFTMDFALIQLEVGPQSSDFELRSPWTELQLCQRYYECLSGDIGYGAIATFDESGTPYYYYQLIYFYKVEKRVVPDMTVGSEKITFSISSGSNPAVITNTTTACELFAEGTSTASYILFSNLKSDAEIY